jgi:hypothetical protein
MTDASASPARILSTRGELTDAIRAAFAQAAAQGCRELWISDTDFAHWPLGERAVIDSLTQWAYAHRRFTMLAQHYDEVQRRHPRFVEWRRQWSHIIDCRACTEAELGEFPVMLIASRLVTLRVLDPVLPRAALSSDAADELRARERFDAWLQRSETSFAATTTGL